MTNFIVTPTDINLLESIFRDPITGSWIIPILTFNTKFINPYYGEIDPLNKDPVYQKNVVQHFYMRLKEKWLFKDPEFRRLLKYFKVAKNGEEGKVSLIEDPEKTVDTDVNEQYRKHIFKYIEKYFISKHWVDKILRQYVKKSGIKWYDLFNNTDILKELFAHKLKKLIIASIYEFQDRKKGLSRVARGNKYTLKVEEDSE